jgi:hypothetical protein
MPHEVTEKKALAVQEVREALDAALAQHHAAQLQPSDELLDTLAEAATQHMMDAALLACSLQVLNLAKAFKPGGFYTGTQIRNYLMQVSEAIMAEAEKSMEENQ